MAGIFRNVLRGVVGYNLRIKCMQN
uniref:Uncharacterized protein n=1 Tax=Anguilla anguilla TaxID=7936 RepID=A0A0E9SA52_ANGAN